MVCEIVREVIQHYALSERESAREACLAALEIQTVDPEVLRELARTALRCGDTTTAIDILLRAVSFRPDDAETHYILGNCYYKVGDLRQATSSFRRATELAPRSAQAHNNYGVCLADQGSTAAAIAEYEVTLRLNPHLAAAYFNLGNAQQQQLNLGEAIAAYYQALAYEPNHAAAHSNLGAAFYQQHKFVEARVHYQRSLEILPDNADTHNNLGVLYFAESKFGSAIECYQRAIELDENYLHAHRNLGDLLCNQGRFDEAVVSFRRSLELAPRSDEIQNKLGSILSEIGQFDAAEKCYRAILNHAPECPTARNQLGLALHLQNKLPEAVHQFQLAIGLSAGNPDSYINLAAAFREQGQIEQAHHYYQRAAALEPNSSRAHLGLGDVACDQRRFADAQQHYERAVGFSPEDPSVHFYRALSLLRIGVLEWGWPEFEWRLKMARYQPQNLDLPRWQGEPLKGQRILIYGEQGLGDTIQFARYLEQVQNLGGEVIFASPGQMLPLFHQLRGVDEFMAFGQPSPDCHFYSPLLSLPFILRTTLDSIPAHDPYIAAENRLVDEWRNEFRNANGLKVGVCWQVNPRHRRNRFRSIPVQHFRNLSKVDGVTLMSLQNSSHQEGSSDELADVSFRLSKQVDADHGAFVDTAAIMKNLDLVITCDTSLAHLAGALGVRVWVVLEYFADWRWHLDRETSPWYPSMRLFRQARPGDWAEVFHRIRQALADF